MSKHWSENYLLTVNNDVEGWKIINIMEECGEKPIASRSVVIDVVSDHIDIYGRDDEASVTCRKLDYKDVLKLGKKAFPFARYGW